MHGIRADDFVTKHLQFTKGRLIGYAAEQLREELFNEQLSDGAYFTDEKADTQSVQSICDRTSDEIQENTSKFHFENELRS